MQDININLHTKYDYSNYRGFTEIFEENLHYFKYGKKENRTITGRKRRLRRLVYNPMIQCIIINLIPNVTTLACKCLQKSLTKDYIIQSMERKKIGQIQRRISMRRLVYNTTIQYIIINLHSKYCYSSLHSFTVIFDEKFHYSKYGKNENWTNAWEE